MVKTPAIEAILFDLDGTLIDTREDLALSLNHTLARFGRPPRTLDEVTGFIGDGVRNLLKRGLGGGENGLIDEALAVFRPHYLAHCADKSTLYPGVLEILERFSGKPLAVVTNKPEAPTMTLLKTLKIDGYFREVLSGDSLPVLKPSPEPVLEAARRMSVSPANALMVGDSPMDIEAGKAAGARTCAVTYGYRSEGDLKAEGPDFIVARFIDLKNVVED